MQAVTLFAYAFVSNVALAVLPHEPAVIWYGARLGVWPTALVATAGTVAAAVVDHRLFVPLIRRVATRGASRAADPGPPAGGLSRLFAQAPFAVIALSGLPPCLSSRSRRWPSPRDIPSGGISPPLRPARSRATCCSRGWERRCDSRSGSWRRCSRCC